MLIISNERKKKEYNNMKVKEVNIEDKDQYLWAASVVSARVYGIKQHHERY